MELRAASGARFLAPLAVLLPIGATPAVGCWAVQRGTGLGFLVVGTWALRSYRIAWGMPLAVVAGFAFLLVLQALVPGTQGICET